MKIGKHGIGVKLGALGFSYGLLSFIIWLIISPNDKIFSNYIFSISLSFIFFIYGVLMLYLSIKRVLAAYDEGKLLTDGTFSLCRHPAYSAWVLGFAPAVVFIFNSLIILSTIPAIYLIFRILIPKEEEFLLNKFGDDYLSYKKNVWAIFPMFWKIKF
ncbi:MAG: methyltransferase family protein [Bacteroidales bacterium]|jgi:protein-S-isoprenylcysteine O-methyltransferase Ste14|nr:isoprenylcysteine carboxylmethyltransferase family protein [Bacteroidales bacterium]